MFREAFFLMQLLYLLRIPPVLVYNFTFWKLKTRKLQESAYEKVTFLKFDDRVFQPQISDKFIFVQDNFWFVSFLKGDFWPDRKVESTLNAKFLRRNDFTALPVWGRDLCNREIFFKEGFLERRI